MKFSVFFLFPSLLEINKWSRTKLMFLDNGVKNNLTKCVDEKTYSELFGQLRLDAIYLVQKRIHNKIR